MNPIRRVVTMLQMMAKKVAAEGENIDVQSGGALVHHCSIKFAGV